MRTLDSTMRTSRPSPSRRLTVVTDHGALRALAGEWRSLEARDSRSGVFQSFTWQSHMWAFEIGGSAKLQLVTVRDAEGRLNAIAPLMIEQHLGPLGVRALRFIGHRFSDYQDILLADDCDRDATLSLLAGWLRSVMSQVDMIEFSKIPDGARLWEYRNRLMPAGHPKWTSDAQTYDQTRHFPITGSFDDYLAGLSKPTRKNFRRYTRRLEESHGISFRTVTHSQDADAVLEDLIRLHQQRQTERGQRGMFRTPQRVEGFIRLFKAMLDDQTLRLQVMEIAGQIYNVELMFYYKHTATAYNGGMDNDPEVTRCSPGFLAMLHVIERAYADPALQCFDLGQGDETYKSHIAKHVRPLHQLRCTRASLRCRLDDACHGAQVWANNNRLVQRVYFVLRGGKPSTNS